jgi:signal peptidase I
MYASNSGNRISPRFARRVQHSLLPSELEKSLAGGCTIYVFAWSVFAIFFGPIIRGTGIELVFGGILQWIAIITILWIFCEYRIRRRRMQFKLNDIQEISLLNDSFVLYIRPFSSGGRLLCRNTLDSAGDRSILGRVWDAELNFAAALESLMQFVAIGNRSRGYGAAKLELSDNSWQAKMPRFASQAQLIIVVPFNRPGTLWEIRQICLDNAIRHKALFFMPPMMRRPLRAWRLTRRHRRMWEDARHSLELEGLALPPYRRSGCFFMLRRDGGVLHVFPFDQFSTEFLRTLLLTVDNYGQADTALRDESDLRAALMRIEAPPKRSFVRRWIIKRVTIGRMLWGAAGAVVIALTVRSFAYEPFNIPSGSNVPTLLVGDYLFVSKFSYGYSHFSLPAGLPLFSGRIFFHPPERGDVVVFKLPTDDSTDYIKRVIGLPGDRIQMKRGILYINDQPCPRKRIEDYLYHEGNGAVIPLAQYIETLPNGVQHRIIKMGDNGPLDNTQVYEVPPGDYFMLGNNRDNSQDSRVLSAVGYVPAENLIGHAAFIFFSTDGSARWWEFWRWSSSIRCERLFQAVH